MFGAILGPAVFGPLFAGRELAPPPDRPWLTAAGHCAWSLILADPTHLAGRPEPHHRRR